MNADEYGIFKGRNVFLWLLLPVALCCFGGTEGTPIIILYCFQTLVFVWLHVCNHVYNYKTTSASCQSRVTTLSAGRGFVLYIPPSPSPSPPPPPPPPSLPPPWQWIPKGSVCDPFFLPAKLLQGSLGYER